MGSHSLLQGDLPNPGIEPLFPALWADSFPSEPAGEPTVVTVAKLNTFSALLDTVLCSFLTVLCVSLVFSCKNLNFFKAEIDVAIDFLIIPTWC